MRKIYRIQLTSEERAQLELLSQKRRIAARKLIKAKALLLCDESEWGPGWKDPQIVEALGIKPATLERLRVRCCEIGPIEALERKLRAEPPRRSKITGEVEAHLTRLACSEAPEGYKKWTLTLLADKLVELELVDSISREAVRQTLKKTTSNRG